MGKVALCVVCGGVSNCGQGGAVCCVWRCE